MQATNGIMTLAYTKQHTATQSLTPTPATHSYRILFSSRLRLTLILRVTITLLKMNCFAHEEENEDDVVLVVGGLVGCDNEPDIFSGYLRFRVT